MLELLDAQEAAQQAEGGGDGDQDEGIEEADGGDNDRPSASWQSYFTMYDDPLMHLPWMRCAGYVRAWEEAIQHWGPTHIKGKVVLDLGCGPGLLSLMCAKAGAKRVIAVDGSASMAEAAKQVAHANGAGQVVQVVCGRAEEVRLAERADVLVSHWPGPALLTGGMLRSVTHAKRWLLKPGALVLPSSASLHVTGVEDRERLAQAQAALTAVGAATGWDLAPAMARTALAPRVGTLERASQLCTTTSRLAELDLAGAAPPLSAGWLLPAAPFELECTRQERLFGLVLHFDLAWDGGRRAAQPPQGTRAGGGAGGGGGREEVPGAAGSTGMEGSPPPPPAFTTSPRAPPTHFQQVMLTFPRSVRVAKGDMVRGAVALQLVSGGGGGDYARDLRLDVRLEFKGISAEAQYLLPHGVPAGAHAALLAGAAAEL